MPEIPLTIILGEQKVHIEVLPVPQFTHIVDSYLYLHPPIRHHKRSHGHGFRCGRGHIDQPTHLVGLCAILEAQPERIHALVLHVPVLGTKVHLVHVHHQPMTLLSLHSEHALVVEGRVPSVTDLQGILSCQKQVIRLVYDILKNLKQRIGITPLL